MARRGSAATTAVVFAADALDGGTVTSPKAARKAGAAARPPPLPAPLSPDFDVFEFLRDGAPPEQRPGQRLRDATLQRMSTVRYDGDTDAATGHYHGRGRLVSSVGYTYGGEFQRGLPHGAGRLEWADGVTFEGTFVNGGIEGRGRYQWGASGDWYEGGVARGARHGRGVFFKAALAETYDGEWHRGRRHGRGVLRRLLPAERKKPSPSDGTITANTNTTATTTMYSGEWRDDRRSGRGTTVYPTGDRYVGEWLADQRHGLGVMLWVAPALAAQLAATAAAVSSAAGAAVLDAATPAAAAAMAAAVVEVYKGPWRDGVPHGANGISMHVRPPLLSATPSTTAASPTSAAATAGMEVSPMKSSVYSFASAAVSQPALDATAVAAPAAPTAQELAYVPPRGSAVNTYRGEFADGKRHGFGTIVYDDGSRFEGHWACNLKCGRGRHTSANGAARFVRYEQGVAVDEADGADGNTPSPPPPPPPPPAKTPRLTPRAAAAAAAEAAKSPAAVAAAAAAAAAAASVAGVVDAKAAALLVGAPLPLGLRDLLGPSESNVAEALAGVQAVVSRGRGLLKKVFRAYAALEQGVALTTTPGTWRRERTRGTIALLQFHRCLSDARILNRHVTVAAVHRMLCALTDAPLLPPPRGGGSDDSDGNDGGGSGDDGSGRQYAMPWAAYRQRLHSFEGELSYRDFVEALIRIADATFADPGLSLALLPTAAAAASASSSAASAAATAAAATAAVAGAAAAAAPLAAKVQALLDDFLAPLLATQPLQLSTTASAMDALWAVVARPLCPAARHHRATVAPHVSRLRHLFLRYCRRTAISDELNAIRTTTATTTSSTGDENNSNKACNKDGGEEDDGGRDEGGDGGGGGGAGAADATNTTMRVRQFALLLRDAKALGDDGVSLSTVATRLFPFEKFPGQTEALRRKHLAAQVLSAPVSPVNATALSATVTAATLLSRPQSKIGPGTSVSSQAAGVTPRDAHLSERACSEASATVAANAAAAAATTATAAATAATAATVAALSVAYRNQAAMQRRSLGLGRSHVHATLAMELELTFNEFIDGIVAVALLMPRGESSDGGGDSPESCVARFFGRHITPLYTATS